MRLFPLAWLAALLPLFTINLTYLISASYGHVDWCIPYIHSCTSISATGRAPPAYFVFKGLMIPAAVILMLYWLLSVAWLRELGCRRKIWLGTVLVCGAAAGIGLIFYSLVLGWIGDIYRLQRHAGVSAFFGFSFFAQLVITRLLEQLPVAATQLRRHLDWLRIITALIFLLGIASVAIGYISPDLYKRSDDAIAWNFTLLLCLHVLISAGMWRCSGWSCRFGTSTTQE